MAKVLGIGGVFFKSQDPAKLAAWYKRWLGLPLGSDAFAVLRPTSMPAGGYTVWAAFKADTRYMEPSRQEFMINLIVDDLEGALRQVKEGGATLVGEPTEDEYGRFGWFLDPEGNKVEIWVPPPGEGGE